MTTPRLATVTRAICAETCAFKGEPPCWRFEGEPFPPPTCDEPGCEALAMAALASLNAEANTANG